MTTHKPSGEVLSSIRDPRALLEGLFEHSPVAYQVYRADGHCLLVNPAFRRLFGSEPPPEYNIFEDTILEQRGFLEPIRRAFTGETIQIPPHWYDPRELRQLDVREGRRVGIAVTMFPLRDAGGRVDHVALCFEDVSAALAREQERDHLRLAQQVARIGTFEWNIETGGNVWTPELEAMYGLAAGAFGNTQQSWEDLIHPEDRTAALAAVARALESADTVEGEWRVVWPDGSTRWLVGRFQAVRDDHGRAQRLVGVNVDITARKLAETEVRSLNENLERRVQERTAELKIANRELEAFSYSVAHDLRGPLRGISGFAEIVLEDYRDRLDVEGREHLSRICDAAVMMGDRIDALLALARLARTELHPTSIDVSAVVRSIAGGLAEAEPERTVAVEVQHDLRLVIDPRLARTLLENLIGNAWKFTRLSPAARIEIGATDRDGEQVVFVRDNGAGFDMSYASKLFLPFQRLHAVGDFPGTGVGLATVRRIVDRHGGRVWAEGQVGGGATFYFVLPPVRR